MLVHLISTTLFYHLEKSTLLDSNLTMENLVDSSDLSKKCLRTPERPQILLTFFNFKAIFGICVDFSANVKRLHDEALK